jgi:UDP-N-acetylglucosamine kinase
MSSLTPSEEVRRRIFEEEILPVVFPDGPVSDEATLVLLGGQPGAGKSRASAKLAAEHPGMVALSGDDLRPFHLHFERLTRSRSVEAPQILAESTSGWVRDCLAHARTTGRSLLLEGTFHTPRVAIGTAELFAREGFATRVAVVATPRAESLLSAGSRYLLDVRAGRSARFTSVSAHERGWTGTRTLVQELEATPTVDRLTVIGRAGTALFDATNTSRARFTGALAALDAERDSIMSPARSMQWLSELRAMTAFVTDDPEPAKPVLQLLSELHEIAVRDVVPAIPLPENSASRAGLLSDLSAKIFELRRGTPAREPAVDIAAPDIPISGPSGGLSRG